MSAVAILEEARSLGVALRAEGDRIKVKGPRPAVEQLLPVLRSHKPELLAALAGELFDFVPAVDAEALEERACIIAEGCGMDYAQALQEARWQAEREQAWSAFRRNAERILAAPGGHRGALLQRYETEAASRYGARVAADMAQTMRDWVARDAKPNGSRQDHEMTGGKGASSINVERPRAN